MHQQSKTEFHKPSLLMAVLPILLTIVLVMIQLFVYQDGSPHIPLAIGALITSVFGYFRGYAWKDMQEGMLNVIHTALPAIFILYVIGMIIGTWIAAGTVPYMVYYGLQVLSPGYFLAAACIICSVVSLCTGTSWGTTGTMGLALMGIGEGLGVPAHMTAGAVVSGAFFGDKMSPLSDTTNFAPAVVGTDLYTHIKNMMPVTVPAMLIALVAYTYVGFDFAGGEINQEALNVIVVTLQQEFSLGVWLLIPAVAVMYLALSKKPALPGLFAGAVLGGIAAMLFQGDSLHDVFNTMLNGYRSDTGVAAVDSLLSKGGLMSMNWSVTLIIAALAFGGVLEKTRCLETILETILKFATSNTRLLLSSLASALGVHIATGENYLAQSLPGRMFAPAYRGRGLHVSNLSRTMEDAGTLSAPLIPWSSGAVFVAATLGVATLSYLPWAIACWASLLIDVVWAVTGWFVPKATEDDIDLWAEQEADVLVGDELMTGSEYRNDIQTSSV
ncbi:Na+/H+ antiporter NhaC [Marinomonas communis]|uniref:Transporter (NhaC family) n=1 Tax=Marinomonas communis TaxID=28254 RepID=A0A4R6X6D0_9GAMM|nr:Na+/H+ antiporter NhaC [Marinomonas communis]TDR12487.1 transporter (NhaC family) [Marinomonas communis]